jgi:type IX secretion system PorP/SprF family membrane protein
MKSTIKLLLIQAMLLLSVTVIAQDALFTQYNFTPTTLNPGLAGTGKNNLRLSAVTKMQWFNLYKPFKYFAGGADLSIYDDNQRNVLNLGLNLDHSSKGYLKNTAISGIVGRSFGTKNTDCSNWFLSLALQAGIGINRVNPDQFIFIDQLNQTGIIGSPSQVDLFKTFNSKSYFDFGGGFVFAYGDFMIGGAVHHLNEPNASFNGKPEDGKLPKKITGHASYRLETEVITLKPTLITHFQGNSSVFSIGTLIDYYEFPIEFGVWYRNAVGLANNSAFSVGISWKWGESKTVTSKTKEYSNRIGLSYDADIMQPGLNTSHGSLEFGIQRDVIINNNNFCPTSNSGQCNYRFPWEFF